MGGAGPAGAGAQSKLSDLGTIERTGTLAEQTYKRLWHALLTGQLAPGEKVTVRGVAEAFGVSLSPAREALARLTAERALDLRPNHSVSVPVLTRARYRELVGIRLLLEGHAAEIAAGQMTDETVAALEANWAAMSETVDRAESKRALELNAAFHFGIYRAAGIPTLTSIIETLWLQVGPSLSLLTPAYQRSQRGLAHHRAAIEAARARDPAALRAAIEADLRDGMTALEPLLPA
ncbi:GntR family transcriptional regulator [Paralimibaculum aggregatum]|nr:GntR family transcriptional regulator [Limibaculum sp. NKW23]